ncbi:MAG: hypothetical protein U0325_36430 [Polyangiales bacterium]
MQVGALRVHPDAGVAEGREAAQHAPRTFEHDDAVPLAFADGDAVGVERSAGSLREDADAPTARHQHVAQREPGPAARLERDLAAQVARRAAA